MPLGRVLALIGALAIVAAYAMPWLGVQVGNQGISLSGQFLGRFLASTNDLGRFMPGATGGPAEVQQLRALVFLFPAAGALATLLVLLGIFLRRRRLVDLLVGLVALVPLAALFVGLSRLPPGTNPEIGLWVIGGGAAAAMLGALLDALLPS